MSKIVCVIALAVTLQGCAISQAKLDQTSDTELCVKYLYLPSANVYQGAREAEIARRGLNCREPHYQQALRAERESQARASAAAAAAPRVYVQAPQPSQNKPVSCSTTALGGGNSVTNCY